MRQFSPEEDQPLGLYRSATDVVAALDHHWREQDRRWRATNLIDRTLARELTITRFLIAALLLIEIADNFVI